MLGPVVEGWWRGAQLGHMGRRTQSGIGDGALTVTNVTILFNTVKHSHGLDCGLNCDFCDYTVKYSWGTWTGQGRG